MATASTRFLVLSDTHDFEFSDDPEEAEDIPLNAHQHLLPKADVLLHCGDLTQVGGENSFKRCLKMLSRFEAELKLVIAGNHDLDLDKNHRLYKSHPDKDVVDKAALEDHAKAMEVMKGDLAKEAGVTYLEEGIHAFTLSNGTAFNIYASQFTPNFWDWGFPYERDQDRFNTQAQAASDRTSIAINPIPSFPDVHIIMTHGPPHMILDQCHNGNAGCENLFRAASRARPLMHCFGHIHEGHAATLVTWTAEGGIAKPEKASPNTTPQINSFPAADKWPIAFGEQTLMVNAAIMNARNNPENAPWLIDLELPLSKP